MAVNPGDEPRENWIGLMKSGNQLFRSGHYQAAEKCYLQSIQQLTEFVMDSACELMPSEIISTCFYKRLSNCAESCYRQEKFTEALKHAKSCLSYGQKCFKGHLRLSRAYRKLHNWRCSVEALVEAINTTDATQDDETRQKLLYELVESSMHLGSDSDIQDHLKNLQHISSSFWAKTTYFYIELKEWGIVEHIVKTCWLTCGDIQQLDGLNFQVDMRHFCNKDILQVNNQWICRLILYFLMHGADVTKLTLEPGDTYLHAIVYIVIKTRQTDSNLTSVDSMKLLKYVVNKKVVPSKEQNITDENGNTILHMLALQEESNIESEILDFLLDQGVDHMLSNNDGKRALQLCDKTSFVTSVRPKDIRSLITDIESNRKLNTKIAQKEISQKISLICSYLTADKLPVIPVELLTINADICKGIVKELIEGRKWKVVQGLVIEFRKVKGERALSQFAKSIRLADTIRNNSHRQEESDRIQLVEFLLQEGASVDSYDAIETSIKQKEWMLTCKLLELGANPNQITFYRGDTPYHAALRLALDKETDTTEDFVLLRELKNMHSKKQDLKQDIHCVDQYGDNLLHVAAQAILSEKSIKAVQLLCEWKISTEVENNDGKLPGDYLLVWHDDRANYLRKTGPGISKKSKGKTEKKTESNESAVSSRVSNVNELPTEDPRSISRKLLVNMKDASGFLTPVQFVENNESKPPSLEKKKGESIPMEGDPSQVSRNELDDVDLKEILNCGKEKINVKDFDELVWDIECTESVWSLLKSLKTQESDSLFKDKKLDKRATECFIQLILLKIKQLGTGDWKDLKQAKVEGIDKSLRLLKLTLPLNACILWELAIGFSERKSQAHDPSPIAGGGHGLCLDKGIVYSQQIRIWEIVLDMSDLNFAVERICQSHSRGQKCIIQKILQKSESKTDHTDSINIPRNFSVCNPDTDDVKSKQTIQCFPPASVHDNEFNILKLYNLSSSMVSAILSKNISKIDFPFKVAEIEHQIITLNPDSPILLLGRSGTGKTTCCLYRLYKEFVNYWKEADEAKRPLIPIDYSMIENLKKSEENEQAAKEDEKISDELEEESVEEDYYETHHDLHQIFVTKNPVLCAEVEKNFIKLCQTDPDFQKRVNKRVKIANRLQDSHEDSFPLFLTSKRFLLLLDASVDGQSFFPRDTDLDLEFHTPGWERQEDMFFDLGHPLLGNQDQATGVEREQRQTFPAVERRKKDFRKECTYDIFANEIWPKINRKSGLECHPSLVWTEIMSFIKGSYEALETDKGFLDQDQYDQIGNKRAPNFTHDRHHVYEAFEKYRKFMKRENWFDETDVIFHIYKRMKRMDFIPWSIHSIYTDETQDFSQAELALLVSLISDQSKIFMAGDTAQSIMKGISFRFADLRSLFHLKAKCESTESSSTIHKKPGRLYQLTHNYRSHTGILSLASALLEIIVELFPDTIDQLEKDQGLFEGPKPVLIESSEPEELMKLLTGNKRDTSHIEFGAHQAILVADDEAKRKLPEELRSAIVLTVYESKGLEFDDVLIYNFFTHSKVEKEWRVVTDFLNKQKLKCRTSQQNLKLIDEDAMKTGTCSRGLKFDSRQHKLLDTELKLLYTAVTRARVNVWIFDEHYEKRGPMFEYFKALELVLDPKECSQSNIKQGFMEKSTAQEWKSKGDYYLNEKKYSLAKDCYQRAKENQRVKLAEAFLTAEEASRLTHNVMLMKKTYAEAGQKFLQCKRLKHASRCFEKAEEWLLSAQCSEKCGQFEDAAVFYKRIDDFDKACHCLMQLGHFRQAIQLLVSKNLFEKAVDIVHTYQTLIQQHTESNQEVPVVLLDNKPGDELTENILWLKLAEHRYDKKESYSEALDKVSDIKEKITFFEKRLLWQEAAKLLYKEGDIEHAAQLMFRDGNLEKALEYASKGGYKVLAASVHMAMAHKSFKDKDIELSKENLKEAQKLYSDSLDHSGQALAKLFLGNYTQNVKSINAAMKQFSECKFTKLVGQLQCCISLFELTPRFSKENCHEFITYIRDLGFKVMNVLIDRRTENTELRRYCLQFYGFELDTINKTAQCYPKNHPLYLSLVKDDTEMAVNIPETQAVKALCAEIINHINSWAQRIRETTNRLRAPHLLCSRYKLGLKCDQKYCKLKHNLVFNQEEDKLVLDCWNISVLLDYTLQTETEKLENKLEETETLIKEKQKWFSVEGLLDFITSSKLLSSDYFQQILKRQWKSMESFKQIERYLQSALDIDRDMVSFQDKISSLRGIVEGCLVSALFKLETIDLKQHIVDMEVLLNSAPEVWAKDMYAIICIPQDQHGNNAQTIKTIGTFFVESFSQLSQNPIRGTQQFGIFLKCLGLRNKVYMMPKPEHLLFWMEFHFCITFFTLANLNKSSKDNNRFYIPNSYFGNMKLVEACINKMDSSKTVKHFYEMVTEQNMSDLNVYHIQATLIKFLLGKNEDSEFSLIDYTNILCGQNPNYLLAERIIILSLVIMLNIPKTIVHYDFEIPMRTVLAKVLCQDSMPSGLYTLIQSIHAANSYPDLVKALLFHFKSRGDNIMMQCTWLERKNFRLVPYELVPDHYPTMPFFSLPSNDT